MSAKEFISSVDEQNDIITGSCLTAEILAIECKILLDMGRYGKAYETLNQGLTLAKKIDNKVLTAIFELYYGDYLIEYLNEPDAGNQHHRRAAAVARSLMNPLLIAKTLTTIGSNLRLQKNIEEGIKFCKHAEGLFKKLNDEQGRMNAANKIAQLQISFGNISAATSILLDLESKHCQNPDTYLNLVNAFIKTDDLDLAEIYLEKSRKYLRGRGDLPGEFLLIYYEGIIEFQSGNFSKAEFLFANAEEFADLSKLSRPSILASLQLVKVLVSKNIALPSKRNFKKAKFAIMDLTSQIRKDESSLEYNDLELLKATLLFSNKEYVEADNIFKRLDSFYMGIRLYEKINIVQDFISRIEHFKKIGLVSKIKAAKDSFAGMDIAPTSIIQSAPKKSPDFINLGTFPILLLILSHGGLPLFSHHFTDVFGKIDETLVSGFLGAIISFTEKIGEGTKDSYLNKGFLQGIRHGDFEILLEQTESYIIALVADKESYLLRKQLKRLAEELNVLFLVDDEPVIVLGEQNRFYVESIIDRIF